MSRGNSAAGCGSIFGGLFAVAGAILVWAAVAGRRGADDDGRWVMGGTGVVFVVVGIGIALAMRQALRQQQAQERLQAQFPGEPWKWREDWRAGRIEASAEGGPKVMWFFAVVWNAMGIPGAVAVWPRIAAGEWMLILVYVFTFIGLLLLYSAIRQTIRARKYGRPVFLPTSVPGEIGGYLGGVIRVPVRLQLEDDLRLSIANVKRESHGSGDDRTVRERILWEADAQVARDGFGGGGASTEIPVLFHIPAGGGCLPADATAANQRVLWRLRAEAPTPGVDFDASFEVPVFATGRPVAPPPPGQPLLRAYREGSPSVAMLTAAGVRVGPGSGEFVFTTRHLRSGKIWAAAIALGFLAVTVAVATARAPVLLVVGLTFVDLLVGLVVWDLFFSQFRIQVEGSEVIATRRGLWRSKVVRIPRDRVQSVRSDMSMASGSRQYYRLTLVGEPGADPSAPGPGESFAARKLRFQLRRAMKELGISDPAHGGERTAVILQQMAATPSFEVKVAGHIPHLAAAERIGAMLLERIRG